jgi:hypothetical protein
VARSAANACASVSVVTSSVSEETQVDGAPVLGSSAELNDRRYRDPSKSSEGVDG